MHTRQDAPEQIELSEEAFASVRTALEALGIRGWAAGTRTAHRVAVWEHLFPNTAGPFRGMVAGQAFTRFDLAAYRVGGIDLCVARGRIYGAAVADGDPAADHEAYTPVTGRWVSVL